MQKLTPQELMYSCLNKAEEQEMVLKDKCNKYARRIGDPVIAGILNECSKMADDHIYDIKQKKKSINIPSLIKTNMSLDTLDLMQDLVKEMTKLQTFYNDQMILITNPDIRGLLTKLRDEVMKAISMLQQRIEAMESKPTEINKIFSTREGL